MIVNPSDLSTLYGANREVPQPKPVEAEQGPQKVKTEYFVNALLYVLIVLKGKAIGVLGVLVEVILTTRAAAKQQLVPRDRPMRVAAFSLTPSVIVAMVLTVKFLIPTQPRAEEIQYIVPIWMMLYGTGVYTAGLFSIQPPRLLGLAFLASGVVALLWFPQYGVVSAALSFGLLHIVFGIYILRKQRQTVV